MAVGVQIAAFKSKFTETYPRPQNLGYPVPVLPVLGWTAPNGIKCARMSSLKAQSKETVRGP
ncbi:hypothetical protein, partial [Phyllobacterium brassicacearum]